MKILGISAFYHDSAAAIIQDGQVLAAAQEERFTRKKHDPGFPKHAISYCLDFSGTSIKDLDAVVFFDKPLLKFERLLETYYDVAPKGLVSFIKSMPVWLKEKMFLKRLILNELDEIESGVKKSVNLLFPEHHLSHAASTFYPSPFSESAILTIDGVGEWATATISHGKGRDITVLKELHFPHSVGLLYSAVTYFLGFRVNSGEYKLMGLAPYGIRKSERTVRYIKLIKDHLVTINKDGSIHLHQEYFSYAHGLRMVDDAKWKALFGIARRLPESKMEQQHCDLALAIQIVTEEIVLLMAQEAKHLTGCKNICLSGGVALNCVANGKLLNDEIFERVYIQPASGDAGGALGAALAAHHIHFEQERTVKENGDQMQGAYLGPSFTDLEIDKLVRKYNAPHEKYDNMDKTCARAASLLAEGNVIGWFQGRMEFGPRALGNRSIIADPRNEEMQYKMNVKIKYRESFRPFAPSVLEEDMHDYFDLHADTSPYMLFVGPVKNKWRNELPANYYDLEMKERLYFQRSTLPAITHVDFSARVQSVNKSTNPKFHCLLSSFKEKTGLGMLVNTSFNVRGEPIVCSPADAYRCFITTEMDVLILENYVFLKEKQTVKKGSGDFLLNFALD